MNSPIREPGATEPVSPPSPGRSIAILGVLGSLLLAVIIWWTRPAAGVLADVKPISLAGRALDDSPFVGTRACMNCHPGEHAAHGGSGHAKTLRQAGMDAVARLIEGRVEDDPEQEGVRWSYHREEGKLIAVREAGPERQRLPLDFALGSGAHAITFVSLSRETRPPSAEEHRLTYFTRSNTLGLTPGQASRTKSPGLSSTGLTLTPAVVLDCLECHGTRTVNPRNGGLSPETLIPNVSCERCHGPGRAHAEAALAGVTNATVLAMPFGGTRETASDQITMCGRCHRLPSMMPADSIRTDNPQIARFPSVGLTQSACFRKSNGSLSCTTCHDAHARASTDLVGYEATCKSCHATGKSSSGIPAESCSVNPRDVCIGCHMPKRETRYGLWFSDHWIRAEREPLRSHAPESGVDGRRGHQGQTHP
jgi:hypothetical protein